MVWSVSISMNNKSDLCSFQFFSLQKPIHVNISGRKRGGDVVEPNGIISVQGGFRIIDDG
jgi:hypothetical protein